MSFYVKLAAFWIVLIGCIWLLRRRPNSLLSRLAFSWWGPVPLPGERKSHLMFRWCIYSVGWLAQTVILILCGWAAESLRPSLREVTLFKAFWNFALPLLAGMALLGALLAGIAALWAKFIGPNPVVE